MRDLMTFFFFLMIRRPPRSTLFPYTTLFRSQGIEPGDFWPEIGIPVRLSARTEIPEDWAGFPVELELWLGGEGLVEISYEAGGATTGSEPEAKPASGNEIGREHV